MSERRKPKRPKAVEAWALVQDGRIASVLVQHLSPWAYGMEAIRVRITPVAVRKKARRRK